MGNLGLPRHDRQSHQKKVRMTPEQFIFEYKRQRRWFEFFQRLANRYANVPSYNNLKAGRIFKKWKEVHNDFWALQLVKDSEGRYMFGQIYGTDVNFKTMADLEPAPPPRPYSQAYLAGFDRAIHGPDPINCADHWFDTKEHENDWNRGKRDGLEQKNAGK